MRTKRSFAVLVGGCVIALSWAGCNNGTWGKPTDKLVPEKQLGVSDIQVPQGFKIDEDASEDRSTGNWRFVKHTYYGKADPQLVREFYRDQMSMTGWKILDDEMHQGQYKLRFESDLEYCDVAISRVKQAWGEKTKVELEVAPLDKAKAAKARVGKKTKK